MLESAIRAKKGHIAISLKLFILTLVAHIDGSNISYEFTRKVEEQVKIHRTFTDLSELFKFLGDYLDPVSMGFLGIKIGNLGVKA